MRLVDSSTLYVRGRDQRLDALVRFTLASACATVAIYAGALALGGFARSGSGTALLWFVAGAAVMSVAVWVASPVALSGWQATVFACIADLGIAAGLGVLRDTHVIFGGCIVFVLTGVFVTIHVPPIGLGMHLVFVAAFVCSTGVLMVVRGDISLAMSVVGVTLWLWVLVGSPLLGRRIWIGISAAADLANYDPLTGVLNRAGLDHAYRELAAAAAIDTAMMVIVIDIDAFKAVNDRFGHAVGDAVLVETAHHLTHYFGRYAAIARSGGEEFTVIATGDHVTLERHVAATPTTTLGVHGPPVTFSVGAASCAYRDRQSSLLQAMAAADHAMYAAKARGGNCTHLVI